MGPPKSAPLTSKLTGHSPFLCRPGAEFLSANRRSIAVTSPKLLHRQHSGPRVAIEYPGPPRPQGRLPRVLGRILLKTEKRSASETATCSSAALLSPRDRRGRSSSRPSTFQTQCPPPHGASMRAEILSALSTSARTEARGIGPEGEIVGVYWFDVVKDLVPRGYDRGERRSGLDS